MNSQSNPATADKTKSQESEAQTQDVVTTAPLTGKKVERSRKSDSAFRTISEVADELDVQQHVLRFWETKFSQVRPLKRGGGRRYYRPEDVQLLRTIHKLLYTEGYTIKGVQKLLREQGKNTVIQEVVQKKSVAQKVAAQDSGLNEKQKDLLQAMLGDLKEMRRLIKAEE